MEVHLTFPLGATSPNAIFVHFVSQGRFRYAEDRSGSSLVLCLVKCVDNHTPFIAFNLFGQRLFGMDDRIANFGGKGR